VNNHWDWLVVVAGLLVRIGVPVLLLVGMVWFMRCLDARWQAAAGRHPAAERMVGPPCWEVRGCSAARRVTCPAFLNPETPCWQMFRDHDGNLRASCLVCELFQRGVRSQDLRV
jgi:hypothetical protein